MILLFLLIKEVCEFIFNFGEKVCIEILWGCRKDVIFVLDIFCFNYFDDFKVDDNGFFCYYGSKSEFIKLDDDGEVFCIVDFKDLKLGEYKLI